VIYVCVKCFVHIAKHLFPIYIFFGISTERFDWIYRAASQGIPVDNDASFYRPGPGLPPVWRHSRKGKSRTSSSLDPYDEIQFDCGQGYNVVLEVKVIRGRCCVYITRIFTWLRRQRPVTNEKGNKCTWRMMFLGFLFVYTDIRVERFPKQFD